VLGGDLQTLVPVAGAQYGSPCQPEPTSSYFQAIGLILYHQDNELS